MVANQEKENAEQEKQRKLNAAIASVKYNTLCHGLTGYNINGTPFLGVTFTLSVTSAHGIVFRGTAFGKANQAGKLEVGIRLDEQNILQIMMLSKGLNQDFLVVPKGTNTDNYITYGVFNIGMANYNQRPLLAMVNGEIPNPREGIHHLFCRYGENWITTSQPHQSVVDAASKQESALSQGLNEVRKTLETLQQQTTRSQSEGVPSQQAQQPLVIQSKKSTQNDNTVEDKEKVSNPKSTRKK